MQHCFEANVRVRSPEVALEAYRHEQFQVTVTSLVPNKTDESVFCSRMPYTYVQEVLGLNPSWTLAIMAGILPSFSSIRQACARMTLKLGYGQFRIISNSSVIPPFDAV
jgi:hypothetical protein